MKKLLFLLLFVFSICQSLCAQQIIDVPIFDGDEQTPFPHPRSTSINPIQCYFNPEVSEVKLVFQADMGAVEVIISNLTYMTEAVYREDSSDGELFFPVDEGFNYIRITTAQGRVFIAYFWTFLVDESYEQ